jgi:hypothetical protein
LILITIGQYIFVLYIKKMLDDNDINNVLEKMENKKHKSILQNLLHDMWGLFCCVRKLHTYKNYVKIVKRIHMSTSVVNVYINEYGYKIYSSGTLEILYNFTKKTLQLNFEGYHIKILEKRITLPFTHILFNGTKFMGQLKMYITKKLPNITNLILTRCDVTEIPSIDTLKKLYVNYCEKLTIIKSQKNLQSLSVSECHNLKKIMRQPKVTYLFFDWLRKSWTIFYVSMLEQIDVPNVKKLIYILWENDDVMSGVEKDEYVLCHGYARMFLHEKIDIIKKTMKDKIIINKIYEPISKKCKMYAKCSSLNYLTIKPKYFDTFIYCQ